MHPRPELGELPPRIARLPLDARGYPVPWFVAWLPDGTPEFRVMDGAKFRLAVTQRRCWVCGDFLGVHLTFVIGPMCAITRTISEPPSHHDCAEWAARHCPFLSRPRMVRREDGLEQLRTDLGARDGAGCPLDRNPGVSCLWTTRTYRLFTAPQGNSGTLIRLGDPSRVEWFAEGRPATRAEVEASISSGLPLLIDATCRELTAARRTAALAALTDQRAAVERLLPEAA